MRAKTISAAVLAAVSLAGFAGVANAAPSTNATGTQSAAGIEVPGPSPADIAQGAIEAPQGGFWDVYSRKTADGSYAGKEDAFNVMGLYLELDPSQLHGPDKTADNVYGKYSCSQGNQQGSPRLAITCGFEGGLPVVAFQQAG